MLRFRPAPLRLAVALAVGFVATRVVYRVLFAGAGGSGAVLIDAPVVRLPSPFEHVAMFGPITTGGLTAAALSALPIALVIVAVGVVNALVDVSRLFALGARGGPLAGSARALVIAWATFPALAEAVRRVRLARSLRGERGAGALIVPILEHTIERSIAIAASMEVRGFGARGRAEGDCERPAEVRDAEIGHGGEWSLAMPSLHLGPGSLTVLRGPTGSGKSTVLDALSGRLTHIDEGDAAGLLEVGGLDRLAVPPRETAGFVGVVAQQPRLAFAAETVDDEIGFSLAVRGVAPVIVRARVAEVVERLGIERLLGRDVRTLSAGEATLVAIAAAIVEHPILLLVDEPLADLDPPARAATIGLLGRIAHEAGVAVLVAEHRTAGFVGVADGWLEIVDGRVLPAEPPAGALPAEAPAVAAAVSEACPVAVPAALEQHPPLATVDGLTVRHGGTVAVDRASFELHRGEILVVDGPNGAGKSSLLTAIALGADEGEVRFAAMDATTNGRRARRARRRLVALVPDRSDDLLFADTVAAECRRADRTAGRPRGTTWTRFLELLGAGVPLTADASRPTTATDASALATRHPRDLSTGQRRLLVLAIQAGAGASVLLVDEPTRGLDPSARAMLAAALRGHAERGGAVVVATHDRDFAASVADRRLTMTDGVLGAPRGVGAPS
ncbi:ATP-binding cassette domain-containing protein [Agromyces sp. CFH 90414]|uniref:ATP-binding cassette domain-containing protein n=1 Tax=Agromyces agglutinans TaxID=2662258 RepID=A0A6I2F6D5_9MICO|nr:ATP-binding cassette domain-containing protein [Agromyces agglutinans]MRG59834.1 ATP-binding cassette domain-containing protein [Agromyces agglutinans]